MLIADGGGLTWTCLGLFLATHNASPVLHFCIVIHAAIFSIHRAVFVQFHLGGVEVLANEVDDRANA